MGGGAAHKENNRFPNWGYSQRKVFDPSGSKFFPLRVTPIFVMTLVRIFRTLFLGVRNKNSILVKRNKNSILVKRNKNSILVKHNKNSILVKCNKNSILVTPLIFVLVQTFIRILGRLSTTVRLSVIF